MRELIACIGYLAAAGMVLLVTVGPWVTHMWWCVVEAERTGSAIALLFLGLFIPPVGWVHGVSIWFGFGWV